MKKTKKQLVADNQALQKEKAELVHALEVARTSIKDHVELQNIVTSLLDDAIAQALDERVLLDSVVIARAGLLGEEIPKQVAIVLVPKALYDRKMKSHHVGRKAKDSK